MDIVIWHQHQALTADEIVSQHPGISLSDLYAALTYYFDHIEEIQVEMRQEIAHAEQRKSDHKSLLEDRLTPSVETAS